MKNWKKLHLNPIEWWAASTGILLLEYVSLKKGKQRTMSRVVWQMKSDKVGKWLLISSWLWLTYHFFIQNED